MTGAHRETDCQRQTEPWGGCNEYAAPCGGDDLINNNKLSLWPGLLGAALCARANGLDRQDCQGSQKRLLLDGVTQDKLFGCMDLLYTGFNNQSIVEIHPSLLGTFVLGRDVYSLSILLLFRCMVFNIVVAVSSFRDDEGGLGGFVMLQFVCFVCGVKVK